MRLFINGETCEKFLDLASFCVDNFNSSLRRYLKNSQSRYLIRHIDDVNDIQVELDGNYLYLFIADYLMYKDSKFKTTPIMCYNLLADNRLLKIEHRLYILCGEVYREIPIDVSVTQKYANSTMVYGKLFANTSRYGKNMYYQINMEIMSDRVDIECRINNVSVNSNYVLTYDSKEFNEIMSMDYIELIDYLKSR